MGIIIRYLWKGVWIAAGAVTVWELALWFGPFLGLALWAGAMATACAGAAWLLKTSPIGSVNWHNRVGGAFLPWGYQLSGGRLIPLTVIAWAVWVVIGAAVVALRCGASEEHPFLAALLFATWMFYGGMSLRQLGLVFHHFRNSPRPRRSMIILTLVMVGLVVVSLVFWRMGAVAMALTVADGPLVLFGGGYGIFLGAMLASGGKGRWN